MSVSALTPPKDKEMFCMSSMTDGGERLDGADLQVGRDLAGASVFELHFGLDELRLLAAEQGVDQHAVLLRDEGAAHLARAGQFVVVRLRVGGQVGIDLFHAFRDQLIDLVLGRQVGIAGVGQPAAFGPVAHGFQIDVDEGADIFAIRAEGHGFLDVREELELVFDVLGRKQAAVGQLAHVFGAVDDLQLAVGVQVAGVAGMEPPVGAACFGRRVRIAVVLLEEARTLDEDLAVVRHPDLHAGHRRADAASG
ncbi:hypothetical protein G6F57_017771 [Rhizopus arrhizus]|nr:hypothetical protein G6F57_017771 [Rhizopus arrhizus]